MNRSFLVILICTGSALIPIPSIASGPAPARKVPAKDDKTAAAMQDSRYAVGQQVYEGSVAMTSNPSVAGLQKSRLYKVAEKVTDPVKAKSLPLLGGKITEAQLAALEYFVSVRFKK